MRKEGDSLQLLAWFWFWVGSEGLLQEGRFQPKSNYQKQFQFSQLRICPDKTPWYDKSSGYSSAQIYVFAS